MIFNWVIYEGKLVRVLAESEGWLMVARAQNSIRLRPTPFVISADQAKRPTPADVAADNSGGEQ